VLTGQALNVRPVRSHAFDPLLDTNLSKAAEFLGFADRKKRSRAGPISDVKNSTTLRAPSAAAPGGSAPSV
jgi:hypothetical protein